MAEDLGEKTEEPTPKRRNESRSEGQIAKSADFSSAILLFAGVLLLIYFGDTLFWTGAALMRISFGEMLASGVRAQSVPEAISIVASQAARLMTPILIIIAIVGYFSQFVQVGWLITLKPLKPKLSRFNPVNGVKKLFSKRSVAKLGVNLDKLGVVGSIAWIIIDAQWDRLVALPTLTAAMVTVEGVRMVLQLVWWLLAALIILGIIDLVYQRWQHHQDLKMTHQEVKDERKAAEGDMETKRRRMKMAREMLMQQMQIQVPRADVVVTNPTHYAVALKYDPEKMSAPRVIAKGADYVAIRIRLIAAAYGVPIVERPPLARALYAAVEPGQEVPLEQYEAVAEVLAYVYRLEGLAAS